MKPLTTLVVSASIALSTPAMAQDGPSAQEKARQGMMRIMALNLGVLGGMAKGEIAFDADQARAAADTMAAISMVSQGLLWPEGTDYDSSIYTAALPAIWEKPEEFKTAWAALAPAARGLQDAVDGGQAAIGPALGNAGKACGACHDKFRAKQQ